MDNQNLKSVNINGIFMILSNEGLKSDKTVTVVLSWAWNKNEIQEKERMNVLCLSDSYMAYSNIVAREVLLNVSDYDTVNDFPFHSE